MIQGALSQDKRNISENTLISYENIIDFKNIILRENDMIRW